MLAATLASASATARRSPWWSASVAWIVASSRPPPTPIRRAARDPGRDHGLEGLRRQDQEGRNLCTPGAVRDGGREGADRTDAGEAAAGGPSRARLVPA